MVSKVGRSTNRMVKTTDIKINVVKSINDYVLPFARGVI